MRYFYIFPLLLWLYDGISQSSTPAGRWEKLSPLGEVSAAIATEDAVWFAMAGDIFRVDRVSKTVSNGLGFPRTDHFPQGVYQFFVGNDGRLHALGGENILLVYENEGWVKYDISFGLDYGINRRVVRQEADGKYLLSGLYYTGIIWQPEALPEIITSLPGQPGPLMFYSDFVWQPEAARLWLARENELSYIEGENNVSINLPVTDTTEIGDLQLDRYGNVWGQTTRHLFRYDGADWQVFAFPQPLDSEEINFGVLEEGVVLLQLDTQKLLLTLEENAFVAADYTEELSGIDVRDAFTTDAAGYAWLIDREGRAVVRWRPGERIDLNVPHWLPEHLSRFSYLTKDADDRVWVSNYQTAWGYSLHDWQALQSVYPGMEYKLRALMFTPEGKPLAYVGGTETQGYYVHRGEDSWERILDTVYNDTDIARLKISESGYLQFYRQSINTYEVFVDGGLTSITTNDFFPVPGRLHNLHLRPDGTQLCVTDVGIFERYGQRVKYYPFGSEYLPETYRPLRWNSVQFSLAGTLWLMHANQVLRWRAGEMELMPPLAGENGGLNSAVVGGIYPLADDDVWVPVSRRGLSHYDGSSWNYHLIDPVGEGLLSVEQLVRDDRQRLWLRGANAIWVYHPTTSNLPPAATALSSLLIAPNPARRQLWISWQNAAPGRCRLSLYNLNGQLIRTLVDEEQAAGARQLPLLRNGLPGGVYVLVLEGPAGREVRRVVWE